MPAKIHNSITDVTKFIHITDTHILNRPDESFHNINTRKSFESVLSSCLEHYPDIEFILLTGDISQTGSKKSYTIFKSIIQEFDLPIYCVPGNHDTPKYLQNTIPSSPTDSINIIQSENFNIVLINSWVKNQHYGKISQHCLQQLENLLQNSQDRYNIIAIHHPPIIINSNWLDELGLQNKDEFLKIVKTNTKNAMILFGHIHQKIDQDLEGIRLFSTPSTCHQFKTNEEIMQCVHTPPPAYRFVKVTLSNKIDTNIHYIK